jgi:hypothetical protein
MEAVMTKSQVYSGGTEENHDKQSGESGIPIENHTE